MYKKAKKSKILTLYDFEFGRHSEIKGNIVVIYLVVKILNSRIGEDAVHLHIDLPKEIDRNIFTEKFCDKLFSMIPDTLEVYYGADRRCKLKDIDKLVELIEKLQKEI